MDLKKASKKIKLKPKSGDILYTNFPDRKKSGNELQEMPHYCIFLGYMEVLETGEKLLLVLYGTSENTDYVRLNEVLENPDEKNKLLVKTKWRVAPDCIAKVPLDMNHFYVNENNTIKCGSINKQTEQKITSLLSTSNFRKTIDLLDKSKNKMVEKKYWNDKNYYPNI